MRDLRAYLIGGLAAATLVAAAACSNDVLAPSQSTAARALVPSQMPFFTRDVGPAPSPSTVVKVTFTIQPYDDNYIVIGQHLLVIPANEVCDPSTSGYGVGTWNLPCATVRHPITVTATASTVNGHPFVVFDTPLRFKPVKNDKDAAWLFLRDSNASEKSTITWCPNDVPSQCVDETFLAPAMVTRWDKNVTTVYRKILHFSGYNITGGRDGMSDSGM